MSPPPTPQWADAARTQIASVDKGSFIGYTIFTSNRIDAPPLRNSRAPPPPFARLRTRAAAHRSQRTHGGRGREEGAHRARRAAQRGGEVAREGA